MPFRDDIMKIHENLMTLSSVGWIALSEHPEQGLMGKICKWGGHQYVQHPKQSKLKIYFVHEDVMNASGSIHAGSGIREQGKEQGKEQGREQGKEQVDRADLILEIWKTYPTNKHRADELQVPHSDATLIIEALAKDSDKVLAGVKAYRTATDSWPKTDRQFIHKLDRFLKEREYLKDPAEWERTQKPEEKPKVIPVNPADIIRRHGDSLFYPHVGARRPYVRQWHISISSLVLSCTILDSGVDQKVNSLRRPVTFP
jgi:hypothetical protein